jgi:hypothetical protein
VDTRLSCVLSARFSKINRRSGQAEMMRKPQSMIIGRDVDIQTQELILAEITLETTDNTVKKVLNKINLPATYKDNVRALSGLIKKDLQLALMFLKGYSGAIVPNEVEMFLMEGLVHVILRTVQTLLAHKCDEYGTKMTNSRHIENLIKCLGCGIGACRDCYKIPNPLAKHYMCSTCTLEVKESWKLPKKMLRTKSRTQTEETARQDTAGELELLLQSQPQTQ